MQLADWLSDLGVPQGAPSVWCGLSTSTENMSDRVKGMIDAAVWAKIGVADVQTHSFTQLRRCLEHTYIDVSQNPIRRPFTNSEGITGTLTTSSQYFSYGRNNFVLPYEHLLWHGHSRSLKIAPDVTGTQLKALAGEGMSLPCLGSVLWAGLLVRFGT